VTRGQLPQRAGSLGLNGGGAAAAVPPWNAHTTQYDTIEEFNVDVKAECDQLNLAHQTKTKKVSAHTSSY